MPSLTQHPSRSIVKLLAFGESKTGKTGSLVSLAAADFKLFILDFDNLLGILRRKILFWMAVGALIIIAVFATLYISFAKKVRW